MRIRHRFLPFSFPGGVLTVLGMCIVIYLMTIPPKRPRVIEMEAVPTHIKLDGAPHRTIATFDLRNADSFSSQFIDSLVQTCEGLVAARDTSGVVAVLIPSHWTVQQHVSLHDQFDQAITKVRDHWIVPIWNPNLGQLQAGHWYPKLRYYRSEFYVLNYEHPLPYDPVL